MTNFMKRLMGAASLILPYLLLPKGGSEGVLMAFPAAAIAIPLIAAGIGAAGNYLSARGNKPPPIEDLLPPGLKFFGDGSRNIENKRAFKAGLSQFLESLSDPGLPASVRERALADLASAFSQAQGAGARQAALSGGVFNLGEPSRLFSVGRAAANTEKDIALANKQLESQRNNQLLALMNFVSGVQGIPQQARPSTSAAALSGGLAGAGAGVDLFTQLKSAGAFGGKTPPTVV